MTLPSGARAPAFLALVAACGTPASSGSSAFVLETPATAVVEENVTACDVDAVCGLSLAFSDTTVFALYGTGEGAGPRCPIAVAVSDVAFTLAPGDEVSVVLRGCPEAGLALAAISRTTPAG